VRLLLYAKGLDFDVITPSGFHGDGAQKGEFLAVNPIGRVPALVLEDGRALPESEVICEYLEDAYPEPTLRPEDPWQRAQVRLLSRISDIYVVMAMLPLFNMAALPPEQWEQAKIRRQLREISDSLDYLEEYIGDKGYAVGHSLTQADGALAPILLLVTEWLPIFRGADLMQARPKLQSYWQSIQTDEICRRLIEETRIALQTAMASE